MYFLFHTTPRYPNIRSIDIARMVQPWLSIFDTRLANLGYSQIRPMAPGINIFHRDNISHDRFLFVDHTVHSADSVQHLLLPCHFVGVERVGPIEENEIMHDLCVKLLSVASCLPVVGMFFSVNFTVWNVVEAVSVVLGLQDLRSWLVTLASFLWREDIQLSPIIHQRR